MSKTRVAVYKHDLLLLHSGGRVMTPASVKEFSARLAGSGIAAGAIASRFIGNLCGFPNSISFADVATEDYVMLTVDEAEKTASRYWQDSGLSPYVVLSTSSVEAVRSLVATGVGVTILSDMVYRPWSLEGQRIEARRIIEPIPTMDVGLAWARARPINPGAAAFQSYMSLTMGGGV